MQITDEKLEISPPGKEHDERPGAWLKSLLVSLLLAVFIAGGFFFGAYSLAYRIVFSESASSAKSGQPDGATGLDGTPVDQDQGTGGGQGRVNIMVLGIDRRATDGAKAPSRTDTIMIMTVDPINKTAGLLSIPRDLWVPIPLQDGRVIHDRINVASVYGELHDYPGGGVALARSTVQYNLGIRIHYHLLLDFEGFEGLIDALGGVKLHLERPLVDDEYPTDDYLTRSIYIPAGDQVLDGERALWYARSRHQDSDFGRMERQQQLLLAMREKALSLNVIPKLPMLWSRFREAVETDLSLPKVASLALVARDIKRDDITTQHMDMEYVMPQTSPDGAEVLLPLRKNVEELVRNIFYDPRIRAERATIEVLNGTRRSGLASKTADLLSRNGFTQVGFGEAPDGTDHATTEIILFSEKEYSAQAAANILGIPSNRVIKESTSLDRGPDIRIILGEDTLVASLNR